MSEDNVFAEEFINKIKEELIEKTYYNDISRSLNGKTFWKTTSDVSEGVSHVLTGLACIAAFAAGFFDNKILSFISGCLGTTSLVLLKFSSYSLNESRERTEQVNILLDKLSIPRIPDIANINNLHIKYKDINKNNV